MRAAGILCFLFAFVSLRARTDFVCVCSRVQLAHFCTYMPMCSLYTGCVLSVYKMFSLYNAFVQIHTNAGAHMRTLNVKNRITKKKAFQCFRIPLFTIEENNMHTCTTHAHAPGDVVANPSQMLFDALFGAPEHEVTFRTHIPRRGSAPLDHQHRCQPLHRY